MSLLSSNSGSHGSSQWCHTCLYSFLRKLFFHLLKFKLKHNHTPVGNYKYYIISVKNIFITYQCRSYRGHADKGCLPKTLVLPRLTGKVCISVCFNWKDVREGDTVIFNKPDPWITNWYNAWTIYWLTFNVVVLDDPWTQPQTSAYMKLVDLIYLSATSNV